MKVESDFTKKNTPHVTIDFRRFIFIMAKDIICYSGSFEKRKKKLKACCKHEMVNYTTLEYNLNLFFELFEDYCKSNNLILYRFLKLQAGFCFIDVQDFLALQILSAGRVINNCQTSAVCRNKMVNSTFSNLQNGIVGGHLFGLD